MDSRDQKPPRGQRLRGAPRNDELARVVAGAPAPMLVTDLATRRITAVSDALLTLMGTTREDIVGVDATSFLQGEASPALPLLVTGQIDGYDADRPVRFPDGRSSVVHLWTHALDDDRPPHTALLVVDAQAKSSGYPWSAGGPDVTVLGSVDPDWRVERISADVEALLGYPAADVAGAPFLGAVHPGDLADLLTGLGHARRAERSVVVRVRLRAKDGTWLWCRACLSPLPHAGGFAFLVTEFLEHHDAADVARELAERLARIAHEVHAATSLPTVTQMPAVTELPGLASLTAREWQVLAALRGGARATEIARMLNLAPSTVRNHLAASYRKLGVASQVALLARLNRQPN